MYNNRTLLTAACRMYLHGNYLCIPNGLTFPFFFKPRRGSRSENNYKTVRGDAENVCEYMGLIILVTSSGKDLRAEGSRVQLFICIVHLGNTFVAK